MKPKLWGFCTHWCSGMSLVEVMTAMVVMAIAILAILSAVLSASKSNRFNMEKTMALNLAIERMEEVKNTAYDDITSVNFSDETGITVGAHPISFSRTVSITSSTYKTVTVTVTWTNFGAPYTEKEEITTIISNTS